MQHHQRSNWADNLRVLATIGVITVHASAAIPPMYGKISMSLWWVGHVYDCLGRFCVPVFVMLSGALLLNRESSLKQFFSRRFSRIILPFLFWSAIYALHYIFIIKKKSSFSISAFLPGFFTQLQEGAVSYHLWYVYMIAGLYLIVPVLGTWIRNATEAEVIYALLIWFLCVQLGHFIVPELQLSEFARYIGYLVLGYYLSSKNFTFNARNLALCILISGFIITLLSTWWLSAAGGKFNGWFYSYTSPNIVLFAVGVFLLLKSLPAPVQGTHRLRNFISRYSYGIYLVHVLVLTHLKIRWSVLTPLLSIPITVVFCLFLSFVIVYCINKLPGGKYISG